MAILHDAEQPFKIESHIFDTLEYIFIYLKLILHITSFLSIETPKRSINNTVSCMEYRHLGVI